MSDGAPTVTPSSLFVEKEQVVVIEFRREIPKNSFLTLDVYYEGSSDKFATLPTALLGPRTVRAMFPVFPKPGTVIVNVLLARDEDSRFPQFKLKVQSPLESLASVLPSTRGPRQVALLAAAVAYLANCDENDKEATMNADEAINEILKALQPADLPEWQLAWFLCGKFSPAENLLHVCTRQSLCQSLDTLLQPWFIEEKAHYLHQKGPPDNKTPIDIAKKRNLVSETLEHLMASGGMKLSTPKSKRRFTLKHEIPRASSIDSNLQYLVQDSPTPTKKKGNSAKRMLRQLFKSETKDKLMNVPTPQHRPTDELQDYGNFCGSSEDIHSVTLPRNHRHSVLSSGASDSGQTSASEAGSRQSMVGKDEIVYDKKRLSRTLPHAEYVPASPKRSERSPQALSTNSNVNQERLQVTEHHPRPVSSLSSGYGSAVSNAVAELKEKAIYKAEVVKQYKWVSSTHNELVLEIGDKVHVTQEVEDNMCLGVCNDHYCKFPKSILCILSDYNVDDMEDEHDYDRVVFPGEISGEDDDEIYKIPRNVPRVASSDSDSDDSDHIYDVPPSREDILNTLISEGHYMKVPTRNSMLESVLSEKLNLGTVTSKDSSREHNNSSSQLQQKESDELTNIPEGGNTDEDGEGIYDVPSSVLRSVDEKTTDEPSEYDVLIPLSTHSAKIADESQTTTHRKPGWGYAEIKDVVPSKQTPTSPNQNNTHSTAPMLQYAELSDTIPSKQKHEELPDVETTDDVHDTRHRDVLTALRNSKTRNPKSGRSYSEPQALPAHYPIGGKGNDGEKYTGDSDVDEDGCGIYDVPSSVLRSIEDAVAKEPSAQVDSIRRQRSSETSDPEETRNADTPEGSEGSDVFVDQPHLAMATANTGKSNSLPMRSHQSVLGGAHTTPIQKGATLAAYSPRHTRTRITSEPHVSPKPRPAKRTKASETQLPPLSPSRVREDPHVNYPSSKLQHCEASPPLPEKPPPVLPEKPPPVLPDKPPPVLPEKPPPALPDKPCPDLYDRPAPALPEKPQPIRPEKPPAPLPNESTSKPHMERIAPAPHEISMETGKACPTTLDRPPKPKPRRNFPAIKQGSGSNNQVEVRSARSHTTATCSTGGLDSSSTQPPAHQRHTASDGSPKVRSTRIKSASDTQRNGTNNHSAFDGRGQQFSQERMDTTDNPDIFKRKAKVPAPPVARKPRQISPNSSPIPGSIRHEHSGSKPPTSPKPKRR